MKKPEYTTICKNGVTYMMRNGVCKNISNVDDSVEEVTFGDGIDILNNPTRLTSDGDSTGWRP